MILAYNSRLLLIASLSGLLVAGIAPVLVHQTEKALYVIYNSETRGLE